MRARSEDARYDPEGHYAALGVGREASAAQIRAAYRELARRYHPDQSDEPDAAERFRRIQAAYEVLRDPLRRMAYDNEWRARNGEAPPGAGPPPIEPELENPPAAGWGPRIAYGIAGLTTLALLVVGAALWFALDELARLEEELDAQLALAAQPTAAPPSADVAEPGMLEGEASLFETVLHFEPGSAALDGEPGRQLAEAALEVERVLRQVPDAGRWVLVVEAYAPRAASTGGVVVEDWELALLRAAAVIDRLVAAGMPPERLAARFQAGLSLDGATPTQLGSVRLAVLCCAGDRQSGR